MEEINEQKEIDHILNEATNYIFKKEIEDLKQKNRPEYNKIWNEPFSLRLKRLSNWILLEQEKNESFVSEWSNEGRLGSNCVDFNRKNCIGNFSFHDNHLQMTSVDNFSTGFANTCVFNGKWQYEVMLRTKGVMQIGWATGKCKFSHEKGVGDTPDSYAYDGNRQRRWNVATYKYGEIWSTGDIISCTIDLTDGTITYFRNGRSLGVAFDMVKCGHGIAYFPALSLAIDESLIVNFGNTPFRYPQAGFLPLMAPQSRASISAKILLGYLQNLMDLSETWLKENFISEEEYRKSTSATAVEIIVQCISEDLSSYLCQPYIVEQVFLPYLEKLVPFRPGVFKPAHNTKKAHILFDYLFTMLQEEELMTFTESLITSLENCHRRVPQDLKFNYQNYSLQMLQVILSHQQLRKLYLIDVLFENNKFAQFMTIECVDLSIMKEKFNMNYWSNKTGLYKCGCEESYRQAVATLQESVKELEALQVKILEMMLTVDDSAFYKSSRFIFLNKLRLFLFNQSISSRPPAPTTVPSGTSMNLCERLFDAFRNLWKVETGNELSKESVSPQMFYDGSVNYFSIHRLGGLDSHLRKTFCNERELALANQNSRNPPFLGSSNLFLPGCSTDGPSTSDDIANYLKKRQDLLTVESHRGLEHLFDNIIMLYHNGAHKLVNKVIGQTELVFDNVDYYKELLERRNKVLQNGSALVLEEIDSSISVLTLKLREQMYQHAWNEVRTINISSCKRMLEMLNIIIGLMQNSSSKGNLFAFVPDFYIETIALLCLNLRLLTVVLDTDNDDLDICFIGGLHIENNYKTDYLKHLNEVGEFLSGHFCDSRIVYADSKDTLIQTVASFICYKPGLRAMENMKEDSRLQLIKHFLVPYEKGAWAQKNWILVEFWKGKGFGFRFTKSPHLVVKLGPKPAFSDISSIIQLHNSVPCPSEVFLEHISVYLRSNSEDAIKFVNSLLNQLNWAFSEFIGMLQEIQNASNKPERIFIDSRHLRVCATCFDLTLALLRVLEMVVGVAPQLFLESSLDSSKSLLCRICQLVCQVLNRTSFSSGCFGHVVNLDIPGLDAIHYYPILTAVAGILTNLLKEDLRNNTSNQLASNTLLKEESFQLSSLYAVLGVERSRDSLSSQLYADNDFEIINNPELQKEIKNAGFSLLHYPRCISRNEMQSFVDVINHLQEMSDSATHSEKMDSDQFCTICYANMPNALFYPCNHVSCVSCISHYLMNRTDCFFCKISIQQVVNQDTGATIFNLTTEQ